MCGSASQIAQQRYVWVRLFTSPERTSHDFQMAKPEVKLLKQIPTPELSTKKQSYMRVHIFVINC